MSAIWSSSERPITVRMVWVDGIRHAILSQDDPLLTSDKWHQRPQMSPLTKDNNSSLKFQSHKLAKRADGSSFESCFVKMHLLAKKSDPEEASNVLASLYRRRSAPPYDRLYYISSSSECSEVDDAESSVTQLSSGALDYVFATSAVSLKTSIDGDITFQIKQEPTSGTNLVQLNTLTERVLQWLDLSGRVLNFGLEHTLQKITLPKLEKLSSAASRRKFSNIKEEGSCMKAVVPTQCFMMQQTKSPSEQCDRNKCSIFDRNLYITRDQPTRALYVDLQTANPTVVNPVKATDRIADRYTTSKYLWTLSEKPQLHIFMPSFQPIQIQWMSSQESVFYE